MGQNNYLINHGGADTSIKDVAAIGFGKKKSTNTVVEPSPNCGSIHAKDADVKRWIASIINMLVATKAKQHLGISCNLGKHTN